VKRHLHGLILALLGGTLLKLAITGQYTRYVKAGLRPYLICAAIILLAVAVLSLWPVRRAGQLAGPHDAAGHDVHEHDDDGHGHSHGRADVAWLLVIPMLAVLLIAPPALGSYSAGRSGTALGAGASSDFPPLPAGDPVRLSVLDYASRAVFDDGRSLTGRQLTLSGFLLANGKGGWYLTRMVITCCAADAQPIKVGLTGQLPGTVHANDWIQATGTFTNQRDRDPVNAQPIPYLTVSSTAPIQAPAEQYES
jgi:putative membrane protein